MKTILIVSILAMATIGHADPQSLENWEVNKKVFFSKAEAIRYIMANNVTAPVVHSRCEILTNKLTFKACPKNKKSNFENEQFKSIKDTDTEASN